MANYDPLAPYLPLGSNLTPDHIAHLDDGIQGARQHAEEVAAAIQAGELSDAVLDAAIDRAVEEGRIPVGGGGASGPVSITEVRPGEYEITGLSVTEVEPGVYEIGA